MGRAMSAARAITPEQQAELVRLHEAYRDVVLTADEMLSAYGASSAQCLGAERLAAELLRRISDLGGNDQASNDATRDAGPRTLD